MMTRKFIFLFLLALLYATSAFAWQGKVIRIVDGDTIVVLNNQNQQVKIRLYGIDTPEKRQAFGQKAKQFTANLVCFTCGQKRYCSQMTSCEEAKFYLDVCGLKRLDGDGDGVPCEKICE